MNTLQHVAIAVVLTATSASSANAHGTIGLGFGVSGYRVPAIGYSSEYVIGYSQKPLVIYPQVLYYGAPIGHYQPIQIIHTSAHVDEPQNYRANVSQQNQAEAVSNDDNGDDSDDE